MNPEDKHTTDALWDLNDILSENSPLWRTYLNDDGSIESRRLLNEDLSRCWETVR